MTERIVELRAMRDFIDREIATELCSSIQLRDTQMVRDVAELYGVPVADVLGGSRTHQVARARQGIAWMLKRQGISLREISRILGYSDKSTAWYAVRKVETDNGARALLLGLEVVA
jgi:chromosomal replication initiation ATPase DnaA